MGSVGIIANPASARDIRRLVADGAAVTTTTKVSILKRILTGLGSVGVPLVMSMTDLDGISGSLLALSASPAGDGWPPIEFIEHPITRTAADTVLAVAAMVAADVGAIVVLGGDGTNRTVARVCADVPLISVSTGTNNAFATAIEPTVAGIAAGMVASGRIPLDEVTHRAKTLVVRQRERVEVAVVDVAVMRSDRVGAGAVWDPESIDELFLTFAEPTAIGLSSIGAAIRPVNRTAATGLHLTFGDPVRYRVRAPIGPGLVCDLDVAGIAEIAPGDTLSPRRRQGVIAVDGERIFRFADTDPPTVTLSGDGPVVIEPHRVLIHPVARRSRAPADDGTGRPP